ncbi:hypothetical protein ACRALDRAFT_205906 [Sodiomyces alcalophilus JCM 7366]|uniref:uncharacterized protein n=1 Tax=Sodiomyces alcalophilus JCM 7366 TaxID=591952 RepID=UPI0039B561A3
MREKECEWVLGFPCPNNTINHAMDVFLYRRSESRKLIAGAAELSRPVNVRKKSGQGGFSPTPCDLGKHGAINIHISKATEVVWKVLRFSGWQDLDMISKTCDDLLTTVVITPPKATCLTNRGTVREEGSQVLSTYVLRYLAPCRADSIPPLPSAATTPRPELS